LTQNFKKITQRFILHVLRFTIHLHFLQIELLKLSYRFYINNTEFARFQNLFVTVTVAPL